MKRKNLIYLDGKIKRVSDSRVDILSPGKIDGKGVFETMKFENQKILYFDEHFARLLRGVHFFKFQCPVSKKEAEAVILKLLKTSHLKQARVRLTVWQESNQVHYCIMCFPVKKTLEGHIKQGAQAVISPIKRKKTKHSHLKTLDYKCFHDAFWEARKEGADEAILLNNRNEIVEGSRTNIFIVKNKSLITPSTKSGCLNGIMRSATIRCAKQMGLKTYFKGVDVKKLLNADEAFLTNSLINVFPLLKVNGEKIGRGKVGPITDKLRSIVEKYNH